MRRPDLRVRERAHLQRARDLPDKDDDDWRDDEHHHQQDDADHHVTVGRAHLPVAHRKHRRDQRLALAYRTLGDGGMAKPDSSLNSDN